MCDDVLRAPFTNAEAAVASGDRTVYRFGPFVIDPAERQLTRDGAVVPLAPKAFDTLLQFVRNSGHMLDNASL